MVLNTLTLTGWNINRDTSLQRPEWPERKPVKCLRKTATEAKTPAPVATGRNPRGVFSEYSAKKQIMTTGGKLCGYEPLTAIKTCNLTQCVLLVYFLLI